MTNDLLDADEIDLIVDGERLTHVEDFSIGIDSTDVERDYVGFTDIEKEITFETDLVIEDTAMWERYATERRRIEARILLALLGLCQ
jgi:hypothetical protein